MTYSFDIREMQPQDIPHIVSYWNTMTHEQLESMGVPKEALERYIHLGPFLKKQLQLPYSKKEALFMIGLLDKEPYGHCYVNSIEFGEEAHMHLHVWNSDRRQKGLGREMVQRAIPHFFKKLQLKILICEPYALNPAPNKTLDRLGFEFKKGYKNTPSGWNFELQLNRWELKKE
ncbi:GNAT family N-acetyltransferase [Spongiimicrobium salis]|uniref:GNAT family N-acetyltransferase n=1 Tax=Spongiimicrobium salis TaxID=1667022 RepID=UPI00374D7987